jgi:hypothetical protein
MNTREFVTDLFTKWEGGKSLLLSRCGRRRDTVVETPLASGGVYANDYCWIIRANGDKLSRPGFPVRNTGHDCMRGFQ